MHAKAWTACTTILLFFLPACEPAPPRSDGSSTSRGGSTGGPGGDSFSTSSTSPGHDHGHETGSVSTTTDTDPTKTSEGTMEWTTTHSSSGGTDGDSSGARSESSTGSTGEPSTGTTTGDPDPMPTACDLAECFTECSAIVSGTEDGDFGPCYSPSGDWTHDCDGPSLCDPINNEEMEFDPAAYLASTECFLYAMMVGLQGRVEYAVPFSNDLDYRLGTFYLRGDQTAMLDMRTSEHCDDGGMMGTRPFKTGVRPFDPAFDIAGCLATQDVHERAVCVFGESLIPSHDGFPWLADECLDVEATCVP